MRRSHKFYLQNDIRIYKILVIELSDRLHIDIFSFNVSEFKTTKFEFNIIHKDEIEMLLRYISCYDYINITRYLTSYYISLLSYKYDSECMFCISTKEYTFNFTLNEIKSNTDSLYGEVRNNEKKESD